MFRNTFFASTPTYKLILGVSLCTIGGAMLYAYFKNRDDDEDDANKRGRGGGGDEDDLNMKKSAKQQKPTEKEVSIKLVVSNEHIPLLLGRNGSHLNAVEYNTNTKICLSDKDDSNKFVQIMGLPSDVKAARATLLRAIERAPIVKDEMYVPHSVCTIITGRCAEALNEICRISLAKVSVDAGTRSGTMDRRLITITGTRQQVNMARKMIEEKIDADEDLRRMVDSIEQNRDPRRSPTNSVNSSLYSSQTSLSSHVPPREKLLASKNDQKPMEVYVSAIASPSKFWVQLIGPQTKKLYDMVNEMTEYYNVEDNRQLHQISEPYLGQIVAAVFKYDGKWYRAVIVGILPNQFNPNEVVLDLHFLDYGDSEYVGPHEVFELRTDFLTLRFQAVECFLANIKSTLIDHPEQAWDAQCVEKFEELTQVANWKKLIARVVTCTERPKLVINSSIDKQQQQSHNSATRESSAILGVELFDTIEGVEINLGETLISNGLALPLDEQNAQRATSPIRYNSTTPELLSPTLSQKENKKPFTATSLPLPEINLQSTIEPISRENVLIQEQIENLQKNNNTYLNKNAAVVVDNLNENLTKLSYSNGSLQQNGNSLNR